MVADKAITVPEGVALITACENSNTVVDSGMLISARAEYIVDDSEGGGGVGGSWTPAASCKASVPVEGWWVALSRVLHNDFSCSRCVKVYYRCHLSLLHELCCAGGGAAARQGQRQPSQSAGDCWPVEVAPRSAANVDLLISVPCPNKKVSGSWHDRAYTARLRPVKLRVTIEEMAGGTVC